MHLVQQRQKQIKNFTGQMQELMEEALEQYPQCSDVVQEFYDIRSKYRDAVEKDKELKFTDQIVVEEQEVKQNPNVDLTDFIDGVHQKIQRMLLQAQ